MSLRGQSKTENWYIALSARPAAVIVINNFGRRDNGGDLQERSALLYYDNVKHYEIIWRRVRK